MTPSRTFDELLAGCNRTELYQVARRQGLNVLPTTTKEELVLLLLGEVAPPENANEIDLWRNALMAFILDNWATIRSQIDCPAKSGDPKSCYQCVDTQVLACLVENKGSLTQIRRKKESR
jgi:hypothetical protein